MNIEDAAKTELDALPLLASSTLAATALELARRLDLDPADREAVLLARELRISMAELRERAGADGGSELEGFLAGLAGPEVR